MSLMSSGLVRPHSSKIAFLHRVLDACVILLTLLVSIRWPHDLSFEHQYGQAGAWAVMLFLTIGGARQIYGSWRTETLPKAIMATVVTWLLTVLSLTMLAFVTKTSSDYSRLAILFWFVLTPVCLAVTRAALRASLKSLRTTGRNTRTLAIAGKTGLGTRVLEKIESTPWLGMQFVGFFDDRVAARECKDAANHVDGVGRFDELVEMARAGKVDYVYITLPMRAEARIVELVTALADTTA